MSQEVVEKETVTVAEAATEEDAGYEATGAGVVETVSGEVNESSGVESAEATQEVEIGEESATPATAAGEVAAEPVAAMSEEAPPVEPAAEEVVAEQEAQEAKETPEPKTALSELEAGAETTGRVVGIADFGAFVDIGAETDGLIHISELSDGRVKKVTDVVSIGQQVNVWIKDVDPDQERISLSMRPKPKYRLRDLKPGMVVDGRVTGIRDYGVFVDIGSETEGLVHVSEMAEGYVSKPSELVSTGDEVEVRIKKVDRRRRRISLSMKGFGPPARPQEPELDEPMPTAMEVAMRRALDELEEQIDEAGNEPMDAEDASRDELGNVFARMLREYRTSAEAE